MERLGSDIYQVMNQYPMDVIRQRCLHLLYQPILGNQAISLYQTLSIEMMINQPSLHNRLVKLTGLSLREIESAAKKLEAIGLMKTYVKKEPEVVYFYKLYVPMTPERFFSHQVVNTLLYQLLGKEEYHKTKACFMITNPSLEGFEECTTKFSDVFDIQLLNGAKPISFHDHVQSIEEVHFEEAYQLETIFQGLQENQIPPNILSVEDQRCIKQTGMIYQIDVIDMLYLVKEAILDQKFYKDTFLQNARKFYELKEPQKLVKVHHIQSPRLTSPKGNSPKEVHIQYLENTSPRKLLKDKNGGSEPTSRELKLVETMLTMYGLEPGVVNVLIEFTLQKCDGALPKPFMEFYAAKWKRKQIKTVGSAMDEANSTQTSEEAVPSWTTTLPTNNPQTTQDDFVDIDALLQEFD